MLLIYDNLRIKDGLHRACILKSKNVEFIDVMVLLDY